MKQQKGFTLIEVMVAVSIFAIVVTIGLSALLNINLTYKNATAKQAAMDQINFAIETMLREIRMGYNYHCGEIRYGITNDCRDGSSVFAFNTFEGEEGYFQLVDGHIEGRLVGNDTFQLTPDEFIVNDLKFRVYGSGKLPGDATQPIVIMTIEGTYNERQEEASFTFQTTVTQRRPDLL